MRTNPFINAYGFLLIGVLGAGISFAQGDLPVIKATSQRAIIEDGDYVRVNWELDPKAHPDVYFVNVPREPRRVAVKTDQDRISFRTRYGQTNDFIVLLNGTNRCWIRILALDSPDARYATNSGNHGAVEMPIELRGSRAYLKGLLNQTQEVTIQFDLGAGGCCVSKLSATKLGIKFDSSTMLSNSQGVNKEQLSSSNLLQLQNLVWNNLPLTQVGNMGTNEDLIIGNSLFRNKVVEIDYDRLRLVVHDRLPKLDRFYRQLPVWFEENRPKIQAVVEFGGKSYPFWLLFDTGRDGTMILAEDFTDQQNVWQELKPLEMVNGRKIVRLNAKLGGVTFKDIVTSAADPAKPSGRRTLLGNQILNHFNLVLDNINGNIYLKPNGRQNEAYSNYERYKAGIRQ
ncbi:MAG TPA: retropepsin-like aspartic protease [Verrucomicrobiae bacterium]|nr:retropepsin-like aspartic protease [Verrucomicrobiae bacterium]